MSTTSTSLRTIAARDSNSSPDSSDSASSEPAILQRERAVLREILRLVDRARRGRGEGGRRPDVQRQPRPTPNTRRPGATLIEKLQDLETRSHRGRRETPASDRRRRASMARRKAKAEFAAASRKLATVVRQRRDVAKSEYNQAKNEAAATFDSGQKKAAKEHAAKTKPIDDIAGMADAYRQRLAVLAADYRKFKLNPEAPAPTRESYDRYSDPSDELFTRLARMEPPLKLLEGLIIPKSMKGGREAWVFPFVILPLVGLALALELDSTGLLAAVVVGAVLAIALRIWLVKLSKAQLESRYSPLMHSLADADGLTAHCRGPGRRGLQRGAQANRRPP